MRRAPLAPSGSALNCYENTNYLVKEASIQQTDGLGDVCENGRDPAKGKGGVLRFPGALKVTCLDRSRRGDGFHGVFLIEAVNKRKYIVKCYSRKRSKWQEILGTPGNYLVGKSSSHPLARFQTEKKVLETWQQHGFDVFQQPDDFPPMAIATPHLVFEYINGRTLLSYFSDPRITKEDKIAALKRFIPEWARRHHLSMKHGDRLLVHEHPSFKHVYMNDDGRLIFFDFETVYTERHSLPSLIGREIAGYVRSLFKVIPPGQFNDFLDVLIREYPHREYLSYPFHYFFRHPNPFLRFLYAIDRRLPRHRKRHSKYPVARLLKDHLRGASN